MLRLSKLADYGTVIMNHLTNKPGLVLSAKEIATKVHVALPTVSKILKILVNADLILSVRGSGGGYRIARDPNTITIADVITALEGPPTLTICNDIGKVCMQDAVCPIKNNWQLINGVIMTALQNITLEDMKRPLRFHPIITDGIKLEKGFYGE